LFLLVPTRERKLSFSSCRYEELSLPRTGTRNFVSARTGREIKFCSSSYRHDEKTALTGSELILGAALTVGPGVGAALVVGEPVALVGDELILGTALTVGPGVGAALVVGVAGAVVGDKLILGPILTVGPATQELSSEDSAPEFDPSTCKTTIERIRQHKVRNRLLKL
jgi:hypothetical protein